MQRERNLRSWQDWGNAQLQRLQDRAVGMGGVQGMAIYVGSEMVYQFIASDALEGVDKALAGDFKGATISIVFAVAKPVKAADKVKDALTTVDPKLVKQVRDAKGKGNDINVKTQQEAEAIIQQARPNIEWNYTYQKPKTKVGKEMHPSDGSGQDLPHIKWKDWSQGKKNGAEGHIYFDGL